MENRKTEYGTGTTRLVAMVKEGNYIKAAEIVAKARINRAIANGFDSFVWSELEDMASEGMLAMAEYLTTHPDATESEEGCLTLIRQASNAAAKWLYAYQHKPSKTHLYVESWVDFDIIGDVNIVIDVTKDLRDMVFNVNIDNPIACKIVEDLKQRQKKILYYRSLGWTYETIARKVGVTKLTCKRLMRTIKEDANYMAEQQKKAKNGKAD